MFVRLVETPNRALLYDLYPYVWDIKEVVQLLDTFVTWLDSRSKKKQQWPFLADDPEPWLFRGGLCGELQVTHAACCFDRVFNPFTAKSDQVQMSPAASPVIFHRTV